MKKAAINEARTCLKKAEAARDRIVASNQAPASLDPVIVRQASIKSAETKIDAYRDFLVYYVRFYNKLKAGSARGKSKGWFDQKLNERATDDLLSYLLHARNSLEHRLERGELVQFVPGPTKLTFSGTRKRPILIDLYFLKCAPIVDRSQIYHPPESHLGQRIKDITISNITILAFEYMQETLTQAECLKGDH